MDHAVVIADGEARRKRRGRRRRRYDDRRRRDRRRGHRVVRTREEVGAEAEDGERAQQRPKPARQMRLVVDDGLLVADHRSAHRCDLLDDAGRRRNDALLHDRLRRGLRVQEGRDFGGQLGRDGAARRQEADDLRQNVGDRGVDDGAAEAEPAGDAAENRRADRALELRTEQRRSVRMAEPRRHFRAETARFQSVDKAAETARRTRGERQHLPNQGSRIRAKPEAAGCVVNEGVEKSHWIAFPAGKFVRNLRGPSDDSGAFPVPSLNRGCRPQRSDLDAKRSAACQPGARGAPDHFQSPVARGDISNQARLIGLPSAPTEMTSACWRRSFSWIVST